MTKHKITKSHLRYFCKRFHFYSHNFGLKDWEVDIEVGSVLTDNRVTCQTSLEDRYCKLTIDPVWDIEPTEEYLNKAAFHENCELLLSAIDALMKERFITMAQINDARHAVIMRLQNLLVD